jgi:hypothetical protein
VADSFVLRNRQLLVAANRYGQLKINKMSIFDYFFWKRSKFTPKQFYFPYFFNEHKFCELIAPFNLTTEVEFDKKTKMASLLHLKSNSKIKLSVSFSERLMIENNILTVWYTENENLNITCHSLNIKSISKNFVLNIDQLEIGSNKIDNDLNLSNFVTFVNSKKIKYNLKNHDIFGIVIINQNIIELIPFDWFNQNETDHGYIWPAIAQLEPTKNKLVGTGMRMGNFEVKKIRKKKYDII